MDPRLPRLVVAACLPWLAPAAVAADVAQESRALVLAACQDLVTRQSGMARVPESGAADRSAAMKGRDHGADTVDHGDPMQGRAAEVPKECREMLQQERTARERPRAPRERPEKYR